MIYLLFPTIGNNSSSAKASSTSVKRNLHATNWSATSSTIDSNFGAVIDNGIGVGPTAPAAPLNYQPFICNISTTPFGTAGATSSINGAERLFNPYTASSCNGKQSTNPYVAPVIPAEPGRVINSNINNTMSMFKINNNNNIKNTNNLISNNNIINNNNYTVKINTKGGAPFTISSAVKEKENLDPLAHFCVSLFYPQKDAKFKDCDQI